MEFSPKQNGNEILGSLPEEVLKFSATEKINMRKEVREIAEQLDISEEKYQKELKEFQKNDKETKAMALVYLEKKQVELVAWASLLDDSSGLMNPEESDVRSRVGRRLGELFEVLGSEV